MKKFAFLIVLALFIINSTASAQDVYASSKDGYDYYVMMETVSKSDSTVYYEGKNHSATKVTGDVKKVKDGKLIKIQHWNFGAVVGHAWTYRTSDQEHSGSFSGIGVKYAVDILHVMYPKW